MHCICIWQNRKKILLQSQTIATTQKASAEPCSIFSSVSVPSIETPGPPWFLLLLQQQGGKLLRKTLDGAIIGHILILRISKYVMNYLVIFLQIIIIIIVIIVFIIIIGLNQNERATRRNCTRCNFWARTTLEGDDYLFGHHHHHHHHHHHQRRFCIIIIIIDNIMTNRSTNPTHKRYCQNQILLSNYQTYLHRFIRSSL